MSIQFVGDQSLGGLSDMQCGHERGRGMQLATLEEKSA